MTWKLEMTIQVTENWKWQYRSWKIAGKSDLKIGNDNTGHGKLQAKLTWKLEMVIQVTENWRQK